MLLIIKRRAVLFLTVALCCCVLAFLHFSDSGEQLSSDGGFGEVRSVVTDEKRIALIVDGEDVDEMLLNGEALRAEGVYAAYCVSANVNTDILQRLQNVGTVLNHSNTHINMARLSLEQAALELSAAQQTLDGIAGACGEIFFPPFAEYTRELVSLCTENGLLPVLYSVDISQWADDDAKSLAKRVSKHCQNGAILYADMDVLTREKLVHTVSELKKKWDIVRLEELLYGDGIADSNGVQSKK